MYQNTKLGLYDLAHDMYSIKPCTFILSTPKIV